MWTSWTCPCMLGRAASKRLRARTVGRPRALAAAVHGARSGTGASRDRPRLARLARPRMLSAIGVGCAAVVSTYPLASQVLGELLGEDSCRPGSERPCDMSVHQLWVNAGVDAHPDDAQDSADQAQSLDAQGSSSPPAVDPRFRPMRRGEEAINARQTVGLRRQEVGTGSGRSWEWRGRADALDLAASDLVVPVVVCGRNTRRATVSPSAGSVSRSTGGDMPALLRAADLVCTTRAG